MKPAMTAMFEGAAVVKVVLVGGDEGVGVAAIESSLEEDRRVATAAEVDGACPQGRRTKLESAELGVHLVEGAALVILLVTLADAAVECPAVGRVGARVVLHVSSCVPAQLLRQRTCHPSR